jgi:formylglycine-generating enzyme required for sulfatase activity
LASARAAIEARDWDEALAFAELALSEGFEEARELVNTARTEKNAYETLKNATALIDAEQYDKAYVKLDAIPLNSVYSSRASAQARLIRHAVALPEAVRRRGDAIMRRIPIGSFRQGIDSRESKQTLQLCEKHGVACKAENYTREMPARWVELSSYYIDEQEVSQRSYATCVEQGGCAPVDWQNCGVLEPDLPAFRADKLPQVCVNWEEAKRYCEWAAVRLPTEAEWEKAAGGPKHRRFPWGEGFDATLVNGYDAKGKVDGYDTLAPCASFPAGGYGLYDMSGNAYEWVSDFYDGAYYQDAPRVDPTGPEQGESRVIRGGAYDRAADMLRVQHRNRMLHELRDKTVGFRCAVGAESLPTIYVPPDGLSLPPDTPAEPEAPPPSLGEIPADGVLG